MDSYEQHANEAKKHRDRSVLYGQVNTDNDPYKLLRIAIIRQAAKDTYNKSSPAYKFWTSDWFDVLATDLEGIENNGVAIRDRLVEIGGLSGRDDF